MHTDEATRTVEVAAEPGRVLAVLRDVAAQREWVPAIRSSEVVAEAADGKPRTAHFTASTPVGTDEYTLSYQHRRDGMDWSLVEGRLQTGQDGHYDLRRVDGDHTAVTFDLRISHNLPLPGFVRRRVVSNLVDGTLAGLKEYVESR